MKRNTLGQKVADPALIALNQYNDPSGAQKQVDVGPRLLPLNPQAPTATTVANAAPVALPSAGKSVAVYNNSGTMGAIAFGPDAASLAAAPAAGTVTAPGTANQTVGLPCPPNSWSYFSAGEHTFVKTSAATLLVFLIDDATALIKQSK